MIILKTVLIFISILFLPYIVGSLIVEKTFFRRGYDPEDKMLTWIGGFVVICGCSFLLFASYQVVINV